MTDINITIQEFVASGDAMAAKLETVGWNDWVVVTGNNITVDPFDVPQGDALGISCSMLNAPTFGRHEAKHHASKCHVADGSGVFAKRLGEVLERAIASNDRAISILQQLDAGADVAHDDQPGDHPSGNNS